MIWIFIARGAYLIKACHCGSGQRLVEPPVDRSWTFSSLFCDLASSLRLFVFGPWTRVVVSQVQSQ